MEGTPVETLKRVPSKSWKTSMFCCFKFCESISLYLAPTVLAPDPDGPECYLKHLLEGTCTMYLAVYIPPRSLDFEKQLLLAYCGAHMKFSSKKVRGA